MRNEIDQQWDEMARCVGQYDQAAIEFSEAVTMKSPDELAKWMLLHPKAAAIVQRLAVLALYEVACRKIPGDQQ